MAKKVLFLSVILLLFSPLLSHADLTGAWNCDDGGTYYVRQIGDAFWWYGEQAAQSPAWSNVFEGRVHGSSARGRWVDVPKGRTMSQGELQLVIRENGNVMQASHKTGGFGGSTWTRTGYHAQPQPQPGPQPPAQPSGPATVSEDCVSFNPTTTKVEHIAGRWKIVDGSHWLFDFGDKEGEARQALRIIHHYKMNQSCFVGRPDPSFTYLLVSGSVPAGSMPGEDCVRFNPRTASVENVGGRWKIVDGSHWLSDFGDKEGEARTALAIIKKYGFDRSCFVGRPDPSFKYLVR